MFDSLIWLVNCNLYYIHFIFSHWISIYFPVKLIPCHLEELVTVESVDIVVNFHSILSHTTNQSSIVVTILSWKLLAGKILSKTKRKSSIEINKSYQTIKTFSLFLYSHRYPPYTPRSMTFMSLLTRKRWF